MTILFVCNEYPPFLTGGIGIYVQNITEQLSQHNIKCLVAGVYDIQEEQVDVMNQVTIFRYPRSNQHGLGKKVSAIWNSFQDKRILSNRIHRLEKQFHPDIIESFEWNGPLYRKPNTSLIIRLHGSHTAHAEQRHQPSSTWIKFWEKKNIQMADVVVSVSRYIEHITEKSFGRMDKPKHVIYNSYNPELFNTLGIVKRNSKQLLFVGKFHERKGVYELMECMNILFSKDKEYRLLFIGHHSAEHRNELLQRINVRFHERITFIQAIDQIELVRYYQSSMLFIMPTKAEAFGLTAIEAMACGCVVAMNHVATATEIITDQENGILVDMKDVNQTASILHQFLQSPEKMAKLRQQALTDVEQRFSNSIILKQNLDLYQAVMS